MMVTHKSKEMGLNYKHSSTPSNSLETVRNDTQTIELEHSQTDEPWVQADEEYVLGKQQELQQLHHGMLNEVIQR